MDKILRLSERLKLNRFKLDSLLDITKGINNNLPIHDLLHIFRSIVETRLGIERLLLLNKADKRWKSMIHYGLDLDITQLEPENFVAEYEDITVLTTSDDSVVSAFDVLIPVFHDNAPLAYLLIGALDEEDKYAMSPTIKHMNFIQTLTNILVVAVENKRLLKQSLEQERVKRELELAAEMQIMLVPDVLPSDSEVDINARYLPHQEVGGDYYDYISVGDGIHFLCIADVSGKGVSAAFLMANFQARMRTLVSHDEPLDDLIQKLNAGVIDAAKGDRFITFFMARYDSSTRELSYVNAGHNPPLLLMGGGIDYLASGCVGLGMLDVVPSVEVGRAILAQDAILVTYTDGLVEMEDSHSREYGEEGVKSSVLRNSDKDMHDLNQAIIDDFDFFRSGLPAQDDIALLSARFR